MEEEFLYWDWNTLLIIVEEWMSGTPRVPDFNNVEGELVEHYFFFKIHDEFYYICCNPPTTKTLRGLWRAWDILNPKPWKQDGGGAFCTSHRKNWTSMTPWVERKPQHHLLQVCLSCKLVEDKQSQSVSLPSSGGQFFILSTKNQTWHKI